MNEVEMQCREEVNLDCMKENLEDQHEQSHRVGWVPLQA